jgi:hypothetical protein
LKAQLRAQLRAADEAHENNRAIKRECNRSIKRKRREYLNEMVEGIQTASERKDPRIMYQTIKLLHGNHLVEPD